MNVYKFIKPLGIITYSLFLFTLLSGLLRWKLKFHRFLAISTLVFATIHALIVILYH
jgi:hypothetical protein